MPEVSSARAIREALLNLRTVIAVSPHLDDVVFSCGHFLAEHPDSTVVTVFAGVPPDTAMRTDWDARSGFHGAAAAVGARREEDRQAAAMLGIRPRWLEFCDSQYGNTPEADAIAGQLIADFHSLPADAWLVPLGLFHSDHVLTSDACIDMLCAGRMRRCIAYEDAPYRQKPGLVQRRLAGLMYDRRIVATPVSLCRERLPDTRKRLAVACYRSQLQAFGEGGYADVFMPERYWLLEPREE